MTIDEIKELLELFKASGVGEMEVQRGEDRIRFRNAPLAHAPEMVVTPAETPVPPSEPKPTSNETLVKSPIVGTFYESPSPGSPAFVNIGDLVKPGMVLCIIESMKLMNEIEAEVAGVVTAKLVENGKPVEYGEALFSIRPQ